MLRASQGQEVALLLISPTQQDLDLNLKVRRGILCETKLILRQTDCRKISPGFVGSFACLFVDSLSHSVVRSFVRLFIC